jgi:membrane peptidoglycan carboxypeptidase
MVSQGGLEVYTSLDLDLQNQAQDIVTNEIKDIKKFKITNGAALVTRPDTGEILSMVGSVDYFDLKNDGQVNLTDRLRQPGSSIKPITYALALENGYTPSTTIDDSPITFQIPGSKPYAPKNYDGRYHGQVTLRQALANSYNIPAVKLLSAVGINRMIDQAEAMGISSWQDRSRFGLSLTLGGGEVRMTDMAEVYGTFANSGYSVPLNPILLVKDSKGNVLYENECVKDTSKCLKKRTLDPRVAYQISDMLSDNNARSAAFGANSVLNIPGQQVAVKTGTTNNQKDNWTFGYTKDRVVSVWVGNNDNSPMSYVASGITGASPIWNKIIRTQLNADSPSVFAPPSDLKKVAVCVKTGTLTCQGCPLVKEEYFIPGTEPQRACSPEQFQPKDDAQISTTQPTDKKAAN